MRKGERRDTWAAFLTLLSLIASHSLLETARDALFLAKIPASHLPWMFLAIAGLSLALVKLNGVATRGLSARRALSFVTWGAAAVTFGFYELRHHLGAFGLYALYVWSGLLATLLLAHFWELVAERFTITQAKRLYGFIGAGSVLGAIAGSGAASLLSHLVAPERLVLIAAAGLGVAGLIPLLFAPRPAPPQDDEQAPRLSETLRYVGQDPYAQRVVLALFLATVCLTVSDFVFKSSVAALIPRARLGAFLGSVYFAVNVMSLLCQLGLVAWLLRRVSLGAALGLLPLLLIAGGLGVAVTGSLLAAVALKASDGALRYSLHRTTSELLVLPFADEGRRRVKAFVDLVGQRGGQVVASLTILGFSALGARPRLIALVLVALAALWAFSAFALRAPYVAVFRARLQAGRATRIDEFPELDVSSLETLLAALESPNDREVLAALLVLERERKTSLVPALLLHHPSEPIVLRVLGILTRAGRKSAVPTIDRIVTRAAPAVRAAALAARSVLAPDAARLRQHLADEAAPEVRVVISANLVVSGGLSADEQQRHLDDLLTHDAPSSAQALAEAIGNHASPGFDHVLTQLLESLHPAVRRASVVAMGRAFSPAVLPCLVDALANELTRPDAEQALAAHGDVAFEALRARFEDTTAETKLRWRIPAAMALCNPEQALPALLAWLHQEPHGRVRFATLLVLERLMRQHPTWAVDKTALNRAVNETVTRAYRYLGARLFLLRGVDREATRKTPGHDLLHDLLRDKELNARGRLFRLLALLHPTEDFGQIYRGLGFNKEQRATSLELIESILSEPLRSAVLGLVDDGADEQRLMRGGRYHRVRPLDYRPLLEDLSQGESAAVREVARFHAQELGFSAVAGRAA
jgi:ATP:ADP antiporter, AAA family